MKITERKLRKIIREELNGLLKEDHSYLGKEDINMAPGRRIFDNLYELNIIEQSELEIEMRRDPSRSPDEYTNPANYDPTSKPKVVRIEEPITGETIIKRGGFNSRRIQNNYPKLFKFFNEIQTSSSNTFEISPQRTVDTSAFITFDAESLSVNSGLFITDGSVVNTPISLYNFLFDMGAEKASEQIISKLQRRYGSVIQQYEKFPTILEFPNGDHGEAAEYLDKNTEIKVIYVSEFDPYLILLPVQSENEIRTALMNSNFEYEMKWE